MPASVTNNQAFGGPNAQQAANANATLKINPMSASLQGATTDSTGHPIVYPTYQGTAAPSLTPQTYVGQDGVTYNASTFKPVSQSPVMTAQVQTPTSYGNNTAPAVYNASKATSYLGNVGTQIQNLNNDSTAQSQSNSIASQPQGSDTAQSETNNEQPQNAATDPAAQLNDQISSILANLGQGEQDLNNQQDSATTADNEGQQVSFAQAEQENQMQQVQQYQQYAGLLNQIQSGTYPLSAPEQQLLSSTTSQFTQAIQAQQTANQAFTGQMAEAMASLGINQSAPTQAMGNIFGAISTGQSKIADLDTQMAQSVSQLQLSFQKQDFDEVQQQWDNMSKQFEDRQTALASMQKSVSDAIQQQKSDMVDYAKTAISAIQSVATMSYNEKQDAIKNALDQAQFTETQRKDIVDEQQNQEKINLQAQAQANPAPVMAGGGTGLGGTATGGSILSAAGLSLPAFNYLTQGTASMSRMPAAQRNQIMNEAQAWLNKNGVDISTFQSQYKAYNDVLQKNISRANQTKIMAGEVTGTADALISAIQDNTKTSGSFGGKPAYSFGGSDMSSLKATNVLDLLLGNQTNNKFAQTYSTQLTFMANDLAGYLAAARGASSPELQDQKDAANIISNGMNAGSTQAFRDTITSNEDKVSGVVNSAVNSTQKQVWDLFGVGGQYKSPVNNDDANVQNQQQSQDVVNKYVQQNPDQAQNISSLYSQGYTDDQVAEYLNQ